MSDYNFISIIKNNTEASWQCNNIIEALADHDKQIRDEVIEEVKESINEHLFNSPMMNPIMTRNEILLFLEQMKGEQNE